MVGILIGVGLAAVLAVGLVAIFNRLVTLRNRFHNAFAQIDVQLKRRHDLIPNLVETAKGYMKHERETLDAVISARNQAVTAGQQAVQSPGDPSAMEGLSRAENMLTATLGRLFALAEAYPNLKADQQMSHLMEELTSTENKIAFARQAYNDAVTTYNTTQQTFPNVVVAGPFGFRPANLLETEAVQERQTPVVAF